MWSSQVRWHSCVLRSNQASFTEMQLLVEYFHFQTRACRLKSASYTKILMVEFQAFCQELGKGRLWGHLESYYGSLKPKGRTVTKSSFSLSHSKKAGNLFFFRKKGSVFFSGSRVNKSQRPVTNTQYFFYLSYCRTFLLEDFSFEIGVKQVNTQMNLKGNWQATNIKQVNVVHLFVCSLGNFPWWNLKLALLHGKQREVKERAEDSRLGGPIRKQRSLQRRLPVVAAR